MKYLKLFYGALAVAMLGACSDRDIVESNKETSNSGIGEVSGYLAVEIKLPQEAPTRAEDEGAKNDQYGDGTAAEYKVDNALIALFTVDAGGNEKDAVFYRAQDLIKPFFNTTPVDDPVSASYIAAIPVQHKPGSTEDIYALVVINRNDDSTSITTDTDGKMTFKLGGTTITSGTTKFSDIQNIITTNSFLGADGKSKFFMINAPMSKKRAGESISYDEKGNTDDITYLTKLDGEIFDTPEEAKDHVSGCVYVERAVAKVTCQPLTTNAFQLTIFDENGNEIEYNKPAVEGENAAEKWTVSATAKYALSNTAKNSYLIRNVDFTTDNHFNWNFAVNNRPRMLGNVPIPGLSNPFHAADENLYRIYWCKDPHYYVAMTADQAATEDQPAVNGNKNVVKTAAEFKSISETLYCKENTFQVQFQDYNSSTLAFFEVDFSIKKGNTTYSDLYIKDGNNAKVYIDWKSAYADGITRIVKDPNVQKAITDALKDKEDGSGKVALPGDFSVKDHLKISMAVTTDDETGLKYVEITNIELDFKTTESDLFDDKSKAAFTASLGTNKNTLLTGVNALTDVTVYEGGVCYYAVPVKHFGDYYTPWDKETIKGTTTNEVYNNKGTSWENEEHAKNYLGRYGMVRNNWYELNISKITALGSSVIPDSNIDTSDDNNEDKKYFALEIHILSWAKRLQNIDL